MLYGLPQPRRGMFPWYVSPSRECTDMANLLKRDKGRNAWSVRIEIPARVQHAFLNAKGQPKRTLVKSLGTTNKVEAKERSALVIARWKMMFKQAGGVEDPLREEAARWRAWIDSTSTGDEYDITGSQLGERAGADRTAVRRSSGTSLPPDGHRQGHHDLHHSRPVVDLGGTSQRKASISTGYTWRCSRSPSQRSRR